MTVTQRAGEAAVITLRLGVPMTLELGQVEYLTPDQTPALDVRVKQRESGGFMESCSTIFKVVKFLHPLHLRQEPLKVLITQQKAGGRVIVEVKLTLKFGMDLNLALDQGMGDGEAPLQELKPQYVHIICLCHPAR